MTRDDIKQLVEHVTGRRVFKMDIWTKGEWRGGSVYVEYGCTPEEVFRIRNRLPMTICVDLREAPAAMWPKAEGGEA